MKGRGELARSRMLFICAVQAAATQMAETLAYFSADI
jgi:hypothetical protein